ncbi:hypothetical protein ATE69_05510 [Sphingopyxis sp. H071]|nr:hypothetical protein ATE61_05530 [Sphingopyxis sp. H057]KTE54794.1 hypothetical protein ATE64_05525 [Sphingopyxis sp. H073]KTE57118.1 hypothetical protein ATE69_05510 [Sphingopyxis sp. H071]KTE60142.1 hypothetical protein ATE66_09530 [Sphingopyxis sp. H107]KTE67602.1 hypothetical protein ATE60_19225 [Sphingopyxis sp. H081]KTE67849.1 hypothetical protein ATE65_00070 [Sphingopyxis sp. H100]KTE82284.1 hypothetical protein ATE63_05145 [Sphingopyxis sp. H067]
MKNTFLGVLLVAAPAAAQAQSTCASYVGTTVAPLTFDQAVGSIKPVAPKGEFETSDAYQARLASSGGSGPLIISKKIEGAQYLAYNADAGAFEVKSYLFDNTNFSAWDTFYYAKVTSPKASTMGNLDVTISSSEVETGTYSAQNGFGAKTTVTKITRTEKAIFEGEPARYNDNLFISDKDAVVGRVPMSVAEAQAFKPQAKIAIVAVPKLPYVVRATYPYGDTTISNPTDVTVNATVLVADIQCGLLMNGTNQVVAAFPTR